MFFSQENNKFEVTLETREFEYLVKKFVEGFKSILVKI